MPGENTDHFHPTEASLHDSSKASKSYYSSVPPLKKKLKSWIIYVTVEPSLDLAICMVSCGTCAQGMSSKGHINEFQLTNQIELPRLIFTQAP